MGSFEMRNGGVYSLPDGREYVAHRSGKDCFSLFNLRSRPQLGRAEYTLHDGRVLSKGVPTRWRAEDLKDTGRTAEGAHSSASSSG